MSVTSRKALRDGLFALDTHNDTEFYRLFSESCLRLGMSERMLALAFDVSEGTVTRWLDNAFLPHPSMRREIAAWLRCYLAVPKRPVPVKSKTALKVTNLREARISSRRSRIVLKGKI